MYLRNYNNTVIIYLFFVKVKIIMNVCAIICEFNPFHNGHEHLLREARRISGCDAILCIMSGSFMQRGEPAVLSKFERAKHAVENGADIVIELPTPFAVAPAEVFARGAISILSKIPCITTLAFGAETADKREFLRASKMLCDENETFKNAISESLSQGESYIKSYAVAFEKCGGKKGFLSTPNNVLGVEYTKAILRTESKIDILPIARVGHGYNDDKIDVNFSSASAIRNNIDNPDVLSNLPLSVRESVNSFVRDLTPFKKACALECVRASADEIANSFGCTEGLENAIKDFAVKGYDEIICGVAGKRYAESRIKRILCQNLLKLKRDETNEFLSGDTFIKPLAIRADRASEILAELSKSPLPTVIKMSDLNSLSQTAKKCFDKIIKADEIWSVLTEREIYNFTIVKV